MDVDIIGYGGLAGTILFGILSAVLGYLAWKPKNLYWTSVTAGVSLDESDDRLSISFGDKKLSEVFFTRIAIWNAGRASIAESDIAKSDHLRLKFESDFVFLNGYVEAVTGDAISPSCMMDNLDPTLINIDFDVLNPKDGFVVRVMHAGARNARPNFLGTLRDIPIFKFQRTARTRLSKRGRVLYRVILVIDFLATAAIIFFQPKIANLLPGLIGKVLVPLLSTPLGVLAGYLSAALIDNRRQPPDKLLEVVLGRTPITFQKR